MDICALPSGFPRHQLYGQYKSNTSQGWKDDFHAGILDRHASAIWFDPYVRGSRRRLVRDLPCHRAAVTSQLIVVDAQYMRPLAGEVIRYATDLKKPITRLYITHDHPDHLLGGLPRLHRW
jgi:glyoxylase-like metal-dependent hydrolase (beta-lactamase superfamily II)